MSGEYYYDESDPDAAAQFSGAYADTNNAISTPYRASVIPPHSQRHGLLVPLDADAGGSPPRQSENARHVVFYRDANPFRSGLKLVINRRNFKTLEVLQNELSKKMPELPRGCRAIFTPRGRDRVLDMDELEENGKYVCSSFKTRAKGLDINKVAPPPAFHVGRAKSGRRFYAQLLKNPKSADINIEQTDEAAEDPIATSKISVLNENSVRRRQYLRSYPPTDGAAVKLDLQTLSPGRTSRRDYKRVYFRKSGEPFRKHLVILARKSPTTYESLLSDLSDVFQVRVRRIFTLDGRPVESISAIFNGPTTYVCSPVDYFHPRDAWVDNAERIARERRRKYAAFRTGGATEASRPFGTSHGNWLVYVKTGDKVDTPTTADLLLTIYGTRGTTEPVPLNSMSIARGLASNLSPVRTDRQEQLFASGVTNVFDINIGNVGRIYKVRLNSTHSGEQPAYYCDEIRMNDKNSGEILVFPVQRWLARDEDDGEICREMPAVRSGETPLSVVKYRLVVTTGDYWNAGTQADIFATLYGEHGDTGVRRLWRNTQGAMQADIFQKGHVDTFELEAVSLGRLRTMVIGHDMHTAGQGWFLERVLVTDLGNDRDYVFPCGRWFDESEGDGKIVRELECMPAAMAVNLERNMWEHEKWKYEGGNELVFFSKMTGKALQMYDDYGIDALGSDDAASSFEIAAKRNNICVFRSVRHPMRCLSIENGKASGKGLGTPGSNCDFAVYIQQDRSVMLENVKHQRQYITVQTNGQLADARWSISGPSRYFVAYCKGMFRDGTILMFATSALQTLSVNFERHLSGLGKRNKLSHFMVHKVYLQNEDGEKKGRVRMFSSAVLPGRFLRITPTQVDCDGDGSGADCQFVVHVHKTLGYVTLESIEHPGLFVGLELNGDVVPQSNDDQISVRFVTEVIKFGRSRRSHLKAITLGAGAGISTNRNSTQRESREAKPTFLTEQVAAPLAGTFVKKTPREAVTVVVMSSLPSQKRRDSALEEVSNEQAPVVLTEEEVYAAPITPRQSAVHSPKPPSIPRSAARTRTASAATPEQQDHTRPVTAQEQEQSIDHVFRIASLTQESGEQENGEDEAEENLPSDQEEQEPNQDQEQEQDENQEQDDNQEQDENQEQDDNENQPEVEEAENNDMADGGDAEEAQQSEDQQDDENAEHAPQDEAAESEKPGDENAEGEADIDNEDEQNDQSDKSVDEKHEEPVNEEEPGANEENERNNPEDEPHEENEGEADEAPRESESAADDAQPEDETEKATQENENAAEDSQRNDEDQEQQQEHDAAHDENAGKDSEEQQDDKHGDDEEQARESEQPEAAEPEEEEQPAREDLSVHHDKSKSDHDDEQQREHTQNRDDSVDDIAGNLIDEAAAAAEPEESEEKPARDRERSRVKSASNAGETDASKKPKKSDSAENSQVNAGETDASKKPKKSDSAESTRIKAGESDASKKPKKSDSAESTRINAGESDASKKPASAESAQRNQPKKSKENTVEKN